MILVQISDSHLTLDVPQGQQRSDNLRHAVATINAMAPQPDVVIHTGDLVNRGKPEEYALARRLLDPLDAPLYVVPGNRDDGDALRAAFDTPPCWLPDEPFVQYSVEQYPVRLLGLDSRTRRSQKGSYCDVRHASLVRALAEQPHRPTLVFLHHPPFEIAGDPNSFQYESREQFDRLVNTLTGAEQVVRVLCGHAHRARSIDLGGVAASTVSSIAVDLRWDGDPDRPSDMPRFQRHEFSQGSGFTSSEVEARA